MAKIHCHSLLSGSSWSSFDEESSEEEPEAMEVDENNTFGPSEATRLRYEDMNLYGLCPAQEEVCLVICKECRKVIKLTTFSRHCALFHKKAIPPPTPTPSPELIDNSTPVELLLESDPKTSSPNQATIKIEKLEIEDSSVKIEEVPLTVPKANHASLPKKVQPVVPAVKKTVSTNKKSPRKVIPTREREFDANKHCGVWVQEQQKRCTRSLTCKTHALSLRRAVPGRRKKFDELLAEHKARVNCEKEQQQQNLAALKLLESKNTDKNNVLKGNGLITEPTTKSSNDKHSHTVRFNSTEVSEDTSEFPPKTTDGESDSIEDGVPSYNDLTSLNYQPKPLATCTFGGKKVGHGALIFNRRQDHLRCAMLAMVERCLNPSQQRHSSGRPGAAAILRRPSIKTIAQSSNHGLVKGSSTMGDKKSHTGSGRNLSNFLKAPPPPRNRSVKHNNVIHGNHTVKHTVDTSSGYTTTSRTNNSKNFMDSSSSSLTTTTNEGNGFLKPDASSQAISDMGNIIASIDANVSNGQSIAIGQTPGNNLRTPGNFPTGANVSLDSSLNLCSNLGINSDVSTTGTRTAYTTIYTTMNNSSTANTAQTGIVKEILPAPLAGKVNGVLGGATSSSSNAVVQIAGQLDPNSGKVVVTSTATQRESPIFFTTQNSGAVQVAASLPNGTGPSPPPIVTSVKGYPLSFVIQGSSGTKGGTAVAAVTGQSPIGFAKGHSLVFNNMGMAQIQQQSAHIIAQQPTSPLQQQQVQQKGKVLLRANSYPKTNIKTSNSQGKIPHSPSPQQQLSPGQTPSQQKTIIVTSPPPGQQNLYLNHQHIQNASQPIIQLKQQVEQQQQQLQQITLQQQLQQQQLQQQQQQLQQQQHKQLNSQFVKQQLPIQPRLAPAPHPPSQSLITQQQISGQNIVIKASDQPLKSPSNSVFVTTDSHQNIKTAVTHKPQSNVA